MEARAMAAFSSRERNQTMNPGGLTRYAAYIRTKNKYAVFENREVRT